MTHTIIITRDKTKCGHVTLWNELALPVRRDSGIWKSGWALPMKGLCMTPQVFAALFGFTPRKGSKTVYEIREKDQIPDKFLT